jgi:ribosomal protein S18 acetylase RimI-like enzyme
LIRRERIFMDHKIGDGLKAQGTALIVRQPELDHIQIPLGAKLNHTPVIADRLGNTARVHHKAAHRFSAGTCARHRFAHAEKARARGNAGQRESRFEKKLSSIPVLHPGSACFDAFLFYEEQNCCRDAIGDTGVATAPILMITLVPITAQNVATFREVRLRALQDTPQAFGSTYARERQFSDEEWLQRVARWNGESGIGYLAMEGGHGCGIAGVLLEEDGAHLVSMWVAPTHRKCGTGRLLVDEIAGWSRQHGAHVLLLMVTSSNEAAMLFYQRLGFSRTGRTEPYPNDPALIEYEMSRPLS